MSAKWRLTGFGGSAGGYAFERMIGKVAASRNGSYVTLVLKLPGQPRSCVMLLASELGPIVHGQHGATAELLAEIDVDAELAIRIHGGVAS